MKLDSRILEGKKPLSCFDTEQAKQFLGKECYFSDHLCTFNELLDAYSYVTADMLVSKEKHLYVGELLTVSDSDGSCYEAGINGEAEWFQFFLPCEWIKPEESEEPEKKYRPYTKHEFLNKFECGKPINIRRKDDHTNIFIETIPSVRIDNLSDDVHVRLFEGIFNLKRLFDEFEWQKSNGEWQPFGIIDESQE